MNRNGQKNNPELNRVMVAILKYNLFLRWRKPLNSGRRHGPNMKIRLIHRIKNLQCKAEFLLAPCSFLKPYILTCFIPHTLQHFTNTNDFFNKERHNIHFNLLYPLVFCPIRFKYSSALWYKLLLLDTKMSLVVPVHLKKGLSGTYLGDFFLCN